MSEYRPFEEIKDEVQVGDLVEFMDPYNDHRTYRGTVQKVDANHHDRWHRLIVDPENSVDCGPTWGSVAIKILTVRAPRQKLVPGYYPKRPTSNLSKTLKPAPPPKKASPGITYTASERRAVPAGYSFMSDLVARGEVSVGSRVEYRDRAGNISFGTITTLTEGFSDTHVTVTSGHAGPCWGDYCHVRVVGGTLATLLENTNEPQRYMTAEELIDAGLQVGDVIQIDPARGISNGPHISRVTAVNRHDTTVNARVQVVSTDYLGSWWGTFPLGLRTQRSTP